MTDPKRLTVLIIVALWCLCSLPFAHAQQCGDDQLAANTIVVKKKAESVTGGAPTCSSTPAYSNTSTADYDAVGGSAGEAYRGQAAFVPGSNATICRVDVSVRNADSSTDWAVVVYNMDGTSLGTVVDASDTRGSAVGFISFTGLNAAVTTGGSYGIVIQHYPISYASSINVYHSGSGSGGIPGAHNTWWGDDKTQHDTWAGDVSIKIYYLE